MSLSQLAARLRALSVNLHHNLESAEQETQEEARRVAVHLSSGTETPQTLRRAGHPYSRRSPNTGYDPAIINSQSGMFRDSWVTPPQIRTGATLHTSVINIDPKARFFEGTDRMVPRLIGPEVKRRVMPSRNKRLDAAIDKTLKDF